MITIYKDIKSSNLKYKNLPVVFDNRIIDSEFEEGFWHIVSRGKDSRLLDFKRAKRLPWLKTLIENSTNTDLLKWVENVFDKKGKMIEKTYIFYPEGRYIVVLKRIPKKYFLLTAFYVTGQKNYTYYCTKYKNATKKGPEC